MAFSSDAIAGFVGVVTGSLITGGFQWAIAARSDWRRGRSVGRLVGSELAAMYEVLDGAIALRALRLVNEFAETPVLDAHRDEFAFDTSKRWKAVVNAYERYRVVVHLYAGTKSAGLKEEELGSFTEDARVAIRQALKQLGYEEPGVISDHIAGLATLAANPPKDGPDRPPGAASGP